jgi:hypothetical protein
VDEAIVSMKRVLSASPGRSDFQFMLVQLYMHKNDYKSARPLVEELAKSTEEEISQPSKQLLSELDSYDKKLAAIEEARKVAAAPGNSRIKMINSSDSEPETDTPAPAKPSAPAAQPDPSSYLREILRTPETGETQLQTTLVRIECDAKGMVFVVRTATGELRLHTRSFDDMELTTYSPDVKGEITCGPRKPENIVIVCYLPNTDKRVKADGILKSIEFVPADFKLKATP